MFSDRRCWTGDHDLYWIEVGDSTKPAFFFSSVLHAKNEWQGAHVVIDPNDGQREFNKELLSNYCVVAVPIVNAWGYFASPEGVHHNNHAYPVPGIASAFFVRIRKYMMGKGQLLFQGEQDLQKLAAKCAYKSLHYVTDECVIKGERLAPTKELPWQTQSGVWSPLEFWLGPYMYWIFEEYTDTIAHDPTFRDWMDKLHYGWCDEREWDDMLRRKRKHNVHRFDTLSALSS